MKFTRIVFVALVAVVLAAAGRAQVPEKPDGLARAAALLQSHRSLAESGPALTLEEAERLALVDNPDIAVAARRVAAAQAHVPIVGALDDPMAMYRGWGIPLKKPWDLNAAQNMLSLSQTFPGSDKRALRTSVAESDVDVAKANLEQARLEVRVRVRKAFDDMLRAQDELRIHDGHVMIAQRAIEAARIQYESGKVPQQDMLKAQVALTRLAEHMIRFDRDADIARAELNTLLGRDPETPIRVEGEFSVNAPLPSVKNLNDLALEARPDLVAARVAADRSHKEQSLAKRAYAPDFTVSAGYMLMPTGSDMRNNYMVEGTMNLPWLNRRKHDAEIAEAAVRVTEQDAELAAVRNAAFGEIAEALVQADAARKTVLLYHDEIIPQAQATLDSSTVAYQNDKTSLVDLLDSQMAVIDATLTWAQELGDFDARLADLEMAAGAPIHMSDSNSPEVKP